jgi:hypothetical protein
LAWFGLRLFPSSWTAALSWLTSIDEWIIDNVAYPSLFALGVAGLITALFLPEVLRLLRRWIEATENTGRTTVELPQMLLRQVAVHLRDQSVWGWRTFAKLNFRHFVQDEVASEMTVQAARGSIRMVGQRPNSTVMEYIDRGYWQYAYVDDYSLWVQSGAVQTSLYPTGNAPFVTPAYHSLSMPRTDVFRTWPRASIARKLGTCKRQDHVTRLVGGPRLHCPISKDQPHTQIIILAPIQS